MKANHILKKKITVKNLLEKCCDLILRKETIADWQAQQRTCTNKIDGLEQDASNRDN